MTIHIHKEKFYFRKGDHIISIMMPTAPMVTDTLVVDGHSYLIKYRHFEIDSKDAHTGGTHEVYVMVREILDNDK